MCPLCIVNIAVLATASSGGVAAIALKTFRWKREPKGKGQHYENNGTGIRSRSRLSKGVGGCAGSASRKGERVDPGSRRAGGRASSHAVARRREGLLF